MNKARIEELVESCYLVYAGTGFTRTISETRLRAALTAAVRETIEDAAKICDKMHAREDDNCGERHCAKHGGVRVEGRVLGSHVEFLALPDLRFQEAAAATKPAPVAPRGPGAPSAPAGIGWR